MRRRVDLPHPDGPSRATIFPGSTTRFVEPTTWMRVPSGWGYDFSMPTASMMASLTRGLLYFLYTIGAESVPTVTLGSQLRSADSGEKSIAGGHGARLRQAVADFCEKCKLRGKFRTKLILGEAPPPVPPVDAGSVHARFAA